MKNNLFFVLFLLSGCAIDSSLQPNDSECKNSAIVNVSKDQSDSNVCDNAQECLQIIVQSIQKNWVRPPLAPETMKATFGVRVERNGSIENARLIAGSGNSKYDSSARCAIINSGPFTALQNLSEKDYSSVSNFTVNL